MHKNVPTPVILKLQKKNCEATKQEERMSQSPLAFKATHLPLRATSFPKIDWDKREKKKKFLKLTYDVPGRYFCAKGKIQKAGFKGKVGTHSTK